MSAYAYDIECLPNFFCATFIPVKVDKGLVDSYIHARRENNRVDMDRILQEMDARTFVIGNHTNDLDALRDFLKSVLTLIGYNNKEYDDIILDYIFQNYDDLIRLPVDLVANMIYNTSLDKINSNLAYFTYRKMNDLSGHFYTIDLMKLNYLDKLFVSLKQVSIIIKWYNVEELSFPPITPEERTLYYRDYPDSMIPFIETFNRYVHGNDMAKRVVDYNVNDVLATIGLYNFSLKELRTRVKLGERYPMFKGSLIDTSRSTAANRILLTLYANATNDKLRMVRNARTYRNEIVFKDIINPKVKFRTKEMQSFLSELKKLIIPCSIEGASYTRNISCMGVNYTFGLGGLHSIDPPGRFTSTEEYTIIDADVTSFYPSIILEDGVCPEHLSKRVFLGIYKGITDDRIAAKKAGDKDMADTAKIIVNAVFGMFGDADKWLYDLYATYKTTVNGQLYLLMLAEMLGEKGFKVISANTDGVLCIVPRSRYGEYMGICIEWESITRFSLEFSEYTKYIRSSVNDYLAVKTDGKFKTKGDFVWELELGKGYSHPIVPIAVREFFVNNTPVIETLKAYNNPEGIFEFCMAQKVGGQFDLIYHELIGNKMTKTKMQKATRFFVSHKGGVLNKKYKDKPKTISLVAGKYVKIFNQHYYAKSYDIDYNYYRKECQVIIDKVLGNNETIVRKFGGNLFGDLGD